MKTPKQNYTHKDEAEHPIYSVIHNDISSTVHHF